MLANLADVTKSVNSLLLTYSPNGKGVFLVFLPVYPVYFCVAEPGPSAHAGARTRGPS